MDPPTASVAVEDERHQHVLGLVLRPLEVRVHLAGCRRDARWCVRLPSFGDQQDGVAAELRQLAGRPQEHREFVVTGHGSESLSSRGVSFADTLKRGSGMDTGGYLPPPDSADFAVPELPPDHPVVVALGVPGEVFWSELAVEDWSVYLATIDEPDRWKAMERASRKVILSNRRMLILRLEGRDVEYVSVPLRDIQRVRVHRAGWVDPESGESGSVDPESGESGSVDPESGESVVHVESRTDEDMRTDDWETRTPDAHVFARKLADLVKTCRQLIKDGDWPDDTGLRDRGRFRLPDDF